MAHGKVWKIIWKFAGAATVFLLLIAAGAAFFELKIAISLIALGLLTGWASLTARHKLAMVDTRTIVRQELRGLGSAPQTVSTKNIDEAAKRLEAAISRLARDQSPLARELHIKTVEEIRFLQAQIAAALDGSRS